MFFEAIPPPRKAPIGFPAPRRSDVSKIRPADGDRPGAFASAGGSALDIRAMSPNHLQLFQPSAYMSPMSSRGKAYRALTSEGFAALTDHARLPSRFHARLSAIASRLRG